jgi:hypothetical protein
MHAGPAFRGTLGRFQDLPLVNWPTWVRLSSSNVRETQKFILSSPFLEHCFQCDPALLDRSVRVFRS